MRIVRLSRTWKAVALLLTTAVMVGGGSSPVMGERYQRARPPQALLDDLKSLDKQLTKVIKDYDDQTITGDQLVTRVAEIEQAKDVLTRRHFKQSLYGVEASDVIFRLSCVDENLGKAVTTNILSSSSRDDVLGYLKKSKTCKKRLEEAYLEAAG